MDEIKCADELRVLPWKGALEIQAGICCLKVLAPCHGVDGGQQATALHTHAESEHSPACLESDIQHHGGEPLQGLTP